MGWEKTDDIRWHFTLQAPFNACKHRAAGNRGGWSFLLFIPNYDWFEHFLIDFHFVSAPWPWPAPVSPQLAVGTSCDVQFWNCMLFPRPAAPICPRQMGNIKPWFLQKRKLCCRLRTGENLPETAWSSIVRFSAPVKSRQNKEIKAKQLCNSFE